MKKNKVIIKHLIIPWNNIVFAADSVRDALAQRGRRLWWDTDGNLSREYYRHWLSLIEEERFDRRLCHNEEGLLQGYWQDDNGETVGAWYAYDAEGRRALKYASERAAGSSQSVVELCDPVYYVSPLVTLTRTGYSKHYFEGGRRICTVIGGGFAHVNWDSITSDPMPLVGPERDPLDKVLGSGAESIFEDCIEVRVGLSNTDRLYKMMQNESERFVSHEPAFYYHTDHLGSTSRFTDDSGKVVQTLAYMPYGEDWVDDSKFIYSDTNHIGIYQFNGKERDFESGFYYYGARYHWPELWTGWTTPDPLMDKYPGISPYNYCNWNPVIFVDPDGRSGVPTTNNKTRTITITSKLFFYGSQATPELSKAIATGIASQWNSAKATYELNGITYKVRFRILYQTVSEETAMKLANRNTDPKNNFIRVEKGEKGETSFTRMNDEKEGYGSNSFWFNIYDDLGNSTTPAHEYGHGLGLQHPNGDFDNSTERPDIMIPRNTPYGSKWSIENGNGSRVVNPNSRRVTPQNVQDAIDHNCGSVNNVIFKQNNKK